MILTEIKGKQNIVTLITSTQAILHEFYSLKKADRRTEKMRIIETAAKLLMEDIKKYKYLTMSILVVILWSILDNMDGHTVAEYTFCKKDQAITLGTKSSVKIDGDSVHVDPQLLFHLLTIVAKALYDLESVFKFELCSYPPALFDSSMLLREPQKPVLADAIWALLKPGSLLEIKGDVQYVLDGGALIQRISWSRGIYI